jgi:hypothetical protein
MKLLGFNDLVDTLVKIELILLLLEIVLQKLVPVLQFLNLALYDSASSSCCFYLGQEVLWGITRRSWVIVMNIGGLIFFFFLDDFIHLRDDFLNRVTELVMNFLGNFGLHLQLCFNLLVKNTKSNIFEISNGRNLVIIQDLLNNYMDEKNILVIKDIIFLLWLFLTGNSLREWNILGMTQA